MASDEHDERDETAEAAETGADTHADSEPAGVKDAPESDASNRDAPPSPTSDAPPATEGAVGPAAHLSPSNERWKRYHAWSGLALAVFLVEHLATNASALAGSETYDAIVGALQRSAIAPAVEIALIGVPLVVHVGHGLRMLRSGDSHTLAEDTDATATANARRLTRLQRITAVLVAVFVLSHLAELRLRRLFGGLAADAVFTKLSEHLSTTWAGVPLIAIAYVLGIAATTFHFANGLARFAARRGKRGGLGIAGYAVGVLLFLTGTATILGLATGTRLPSPSGGGKDGACGSPATSQR